MLAPLLVLLLATAETGRAPLPPRFRDEGRNAGDDDYRPLPDQRGTFARGTSGVAWNSEYDGPPCRGTPAEQDAALKRQGDARSQFWFYATRAQGILFKRSSGFDPTRACAASPTWTYDVERAWVADGWIHSVDVDDTNDMTADGSWPVTSSAGAYASEFRMLQSLMARPGPDRRRRRHGFETVAGVRAECRGFSGLVWSSVCVATGGPAKGMILSAANGDDERVMSALTIGELRVAATLPGKLFEIDRTWTGQE